MCKGVGQCDQIWRNFAVLANFNSLWEIFGLVFGKLLHLLWQIYATGQIFNDTYVNSQKNSTAIWSHWCWVKIVKCMYQVTLNIVTRLKIENDAKSKCELLGVFK